MHDKRLNVGSRMNDKRRNGFQRGVEGRKDSKGTKHGDLRRERWEEKC
jgi:hypothetical protein